MFATVAFADSTPSGVPSPTKTPEDDQAKIAEYKQACQFIDALIVRKEFQVECYNNYQHYGPTSKSAFTSSQIRIAGYNLLHPGTSKSLFKDYGLVAKIINKYDVVAGMELLATVGHDEANNQSVLEFLRENAKLMEDLKVQRTAEKNPTKRKAIEAHLNKVIASLNDGASLYRAPGYLKILIALKKLDPSWALILSPRGDSALQGSVEELVGFFYRANAATPILNPHCNEFKDTKSGTPYACIANMTSKFMDKDYSHHFARRPFLASFKSGSMKFSLISSHVVFNFSGDDDAAKKLMNDVFNVDSPNDIGGGMNLTTFARFAEVKTTLDFMNRFKQKYNDKNIIYVADTNIVANNSFWPDVLKSFPGGSLLIDEPSTISPPRYKSDGQETLGVASSYDHFILDKTTFPGCDDGKVYNYYNSDINLDIGKKYLIRGTNPIALRNKNFELLENDGVMIGGDIPPDDTPLPPKLDYAITKAGQIKAEGLVANYVAELTNMRTVKNNAITPDDFQLPERIESFKRRVLINQLTNAFYFRFYQELLSDHFPASITCKLGLGTRVK